MDSIISLIFEKGVLAEVGLVIPNPKRGLYGGTVLDRCIARCWRNLLRTKGALNALWRAPYAEIYQPAWQLGAIALGR